ncbi:MAG: hypothetical protein JWQ18_2540 [Conexibacter sp.]|nr:hypothetical protein [Conexibacter sp.]
MSTTQRTHARTVSVDPCLVDVLRDQTLVVLEVNHHHFEDLRDFGPAAQHAVSVIYRDAFAVLDAIGWSDDPPAEPVAVPLSDGHVEQLHRCRHDLGATNLDRLDLLDATPDPPAELPPEITAARLAAQALDALFSAWGRAGRG